MGHKNNMIYDETIATLNGMRAFGTSKHMDKAQNETKDKIYSYSTFRTYKDKCCDFVTYARKEHKCYTLQQAQVYVGEFLKKKIDDGCSPWTIKLYANALGKLYQVPSNSFIDLPSRSRHDITRSRNDATRDRHFSTKNNAPLIEFCKHVGLRRSELENIKGKDLFLENGQYYIHVENGKGGKSRNVPILDNNPLVIEKMTYTLPNERVWGKVHSGCDVHSYRSEYANSLYNKLARPLDTLSRSEKYYCRKDMAGRIFDKEAMHEVSKALGHERICVIAYSYLR